MNPKNPVFAAFVVPIEAPDLEWIGLLSVLWSQVEYCIEAAIYNLQGMNFAEGRATELPRDVSAKANRLMALAGDKCERDQRLEFIKLCERVLALAPKRNLAVHGHWCRLRDHDLAPAAVSWWRVPVDQKIARLLPAELPAIATEAGAISRGLYELLKKRGAFEIEQ